jgi:class 3 adenylate cyclase/tetratricopeptide (TPR) repeat protein
VTHLASPSAGATCPACGAGAPAEARFCPACGGPLRAGGEERRVVTVLFADLVDSTGLVESLDPEAVRGLLNEMFRRLATEVRRFGGTVEKYIGDAILAVFGFPTGHDDDAARAARAALTMRDLVKTADTALGDIPLRLRMGLDTGEVSTGVWADELRVAGPPVHTAARIQQAAEPDQILLSMRTLRAARDAIEAGPPRPLHARGQRQPVEVVEVLGLAAAEPAPEPLIDRELDLPRLVGALDHAAHHNRLVLLVGEAGVGKSALARAAAAEIGDRVHVLWGRCLPEWQSLPFWPVREVLAAAAGSAPTEPSGTLAASIGRLVAETSEDPGGAAATVGALCRLAGVEPGDQAGAPGLPGDARELAAALAGVLCGLARRERVLVVLEDLHWATPDLLDMAAVLIAGGCRPEGQLAFLGISRPDLTGLDPAWLVRTGSERIDLDPLPEASAGALLEAVLGSEAAPELAGRVFEASRGNPLFVKELALAFRETGRTRAGGPDLVIPDTLQALVSARLDRLPAPAKRVLCRAAVVGKWFSRAAVAALAEPGEPPPDADLDLLVRAGLIERLPERLAGEQERFAFHHALFREVAYALMPKAARSELHRRLADWLAGDPGGELSLPEVTAAHLVRAVRLAGEVRALTPADRALAGRAVAACRRAARRLRDQEALVAAGRVLDDALSLTGAAGTPAEEELELLAARGAVRAGTGQLAEALSDLRAAAESERPEVRAQAWTELASLYPVLGKFSEASAAADQALAEALDAGDPGLVALALRAKAHEPYLAGELVEAELLLTEAIAGARRAGRADLVLDLRSTLLPVRLYLASPLPDLVAEAAALARDARAGGRRNAEAGGHYCLGEAALLAGDLAAAEHHYATANRLRTEIGLTERRLWPLCGLVQVAIARGDPGRARALAEEAIAVTTRPDGTADVEAELHLAEACLAAGELEAAGAAVARAWAEPLEDDVYSRARLLRTQARLAAATGDPGAAVGLLERSLAALSDTDHHQERLRTLVELAPALRRVGRSDEADRVAERAGGAVAAMGAEALLRRLAGGPPAGGARSREGAG